MGSETAVGINFLAVLVAAIVYMILGAIWYAPPIFGKAWMRGIGKTAEQIKADSRPLNYVAALFMSYLAAYGIARIMLWSGGETIRDGLMVGLVVGICFAFSMFTTNDRFEGRPGGLTIINSFYHIISFLVIGAIIGAWPW